jgi:hypothetical protein
VTLSVVHNIQFPEPGITLGTSGDTLLTTRSTSSGTAVVDVDFGKYSGTFSVVVAAQGVARPDTETFTVQPGAVASLRIPTPDTLVTIGIPYKSLIFAADRNGNPPLDPPTLSSARSVCQLNGATVTASDIARCVITVRAGALRDSFTVNAVPRIPVTVLVGGFGPRSIATMNLDGSALKLIRIINRDIFDPVHPRVGPNGLIAGINVGSDNKTHIEIIDSTGAARFIPVDLPNGAEENWPVFSRDGQWLYFSACNWAVFEHCRVWQTKFDGSQAKILTPSTRSSGQRTNWTTVSSDGRMMAYAGFGERVHTLNLQTGADVDLAINTRSFDLNSTGTKLVYLNDAVYTGPLFISNIDGTNPIVLGGGRAFSATAQFLPGDQWLLSIALLADSHDSSGDYVLLNVTTAELVPIRYTTFVNELYIVK